MRSANLHTFRGQITGAPVDLVFMPSASAEPPPIDKAARRAAPGPGNPDGRGWDRLFGMRWFLRSETGSAEQGTALGTATFDQSVQRARRFANSSTR